MKAIITELDFIERCNQLEGMLSIHKDIHTSLVSGSHFLFLCITSDDGFFGSVFLSAIFKCFPFDGKHFYVNVCPHSIRVQYI